MGKTVSHPMMHVPGKANPGQMASALAALAITLAAPCTLAGPITASDFSAAAITQDYAGLGLSVFPPTKLTAPITIDGHTYTTNNGQLRYLTQFLANDTDLGFIDIALGAGVSRAGLVTTNPSGNIGAWTSSVEFFDLFNVLLGTVTVSGSNGFGVVDFQFAGWEADAGLIGRVRVTDLTSNNVVLAIDDLTLDPAAAPEPASLALLGIGLAGLGFARKKRAH